MLKYLLFSTWLVSSLAFALPKSVEVWFLSAEPVSKSYFNLSNELYAQGRIQCQPMGEYCFDPQVGLYKKGEEKKVQEAADYSAVEAANKYDFIDPPKSTERELIKCDGKSFFDIFCGKAKKQKKDNVKLEIWIDQSSTMRQVDGADLNNSCRRSRFVKSLNVACPLNEKLKVHYFTVHKKEAGTLNNLCHSSGTNQMKNIIRYLKQTKREKILIITDIFEAQGEFLDELKNLGVVKIKGVEQPMYASELRNQLGHVQKMCL